MKDKTELELYCEQRFKENGIRFKYQDLSFPIVNGRGVQFDIYSKNIKSVCYAPIVLTASYSILEDNVFTHMIDIIEDKSIIDERFLMNYLSDWKYLKTLSMVNNKHEVDEAIKRITESRD